MLHVTEAASHELRRFRQQRNLDEAHGVRVATDSTGKVHLRIDAVESDDLVVSDTSGPLVMVSPDVASRLAGVIVDYETAESTASGRFLLRHPHAR